MPTTMKKVALVTCAAVTLAAATLATTGSAEARWYGHRGWHGGGWAGPAIVGGLALGALAASRPYYGYPAYGYGDGCLRRRIVGQTYYGRPIFRTSTSATEFESKLKSESSGLPELSALREDIRNAPHGRTRKPVTRSGRRMPPQATAQNSSERSGRSGNRRRARRAHR